MGRGALGVAQRSVPSFSGSAAIGVFGPCQIPECAVRSGSVVILLPLGQHGPGLSQRSEQGLIEQFVTQPAVETLDEGVLLRFAWRDVVPRDPRLLDPALNSVLLSETHIAGRPRWAMMASSSRATRKPPSQRLKCGCRRFRATRSRSFSCCLCVPAVPFGDETIQACLSLGDRKNLASIGEAGRKATSLCLGLLMPGRSPPDGVLQLPSRFKPHQLPEGQFTKFSSLAGNLK